MFPFVSHASALHLLVFVGGIDEVVRKKPYQCVWQRETEGLDALELRIW